MKCVLLAVLILSCKSIRCLLSSLIITPKYLKFFTLSDVQFLLLIVQFYFVWNCFSVPLSYVLFLLDLCLVLIFWQCFLFQQKSCLIYISFFPTSTVSSAYANTFNLSLPIFMPLGTIFILCITFCNAKLNKSGVSILYYFQKRMTVFLLF